MRDSTWAPARLAVGIVVVAAIGAFVNDPIIRVGGRGVGVYSHYPTDLAQMPPSEPERNTRDLASNGAGRKCRFYAPFQTVAERAMERRMCNLYSMTATVDEIRRVFGAFEGDTMNLPPFDNIYPGHPAPALRRAESARLKLELMTWGLPGPAAAGARPVTNVRNLESPFWRSSLHNPRWRCLIPVTRFCEYGGARSSHRPQIQGLVWTVRPAGFRVRGRVATGGQRLIDGLPHLRGKQRCWGRSPKGDAGHPRTRQL